jgi:hypothetical protein
MALPRFFYKLNWRLMLIHLVACWLFINAFRTLSYLHDPELISFIAHLHRPDFKHPDKFLKDISRFGGFGLRLTYLLLWAEGGAIAGLLAGFAVSLFIAIKKHWYWLNSLVVFVVLALLGVLKVSVWQYLKVILLKPGLVFKTFSVGYFLVNGLVMLGLGLLLFFGDKVIIFINSDWPTSPKVRLQTGGLNDEQ